MSTVEGMTRLWRQFLADAWYLFVGFPIAVAAFFVATNGLLIGVSSVIVVGLPVLALSMKGLRCLANVERRRVEKVLGTRLAWPAYKSPPPHAHLVRRLVTPITDVQCWLDVLYAMLCLFAPMVFVFWLSSPLLLALVLAESGSGDWSILAVNLVLMFPLPLVARAGAFVQVGLGRVLLSGVGELHEQITGLEARRQAAVSAEAIALRRLERDIHDGPQQRLVRLAVDLGRAERLLDSDPAAARRVMVEALAETEETLGELRALSRGIAPPILSDRGLVAAISAIAGRSTVPVSLETDEFGRLEPAMENTAYFIVAESLTNVAKHSRASQCRVAMQRLGNRLLVTVTDDGVGGAQLAKGHGLTGLTDRAQAVGGSLCVTSPTGGPTTIAAELPCFA